MSLGREFVHFLRHEKKWWLLPMAVVALGFAAFLVVSALTGGASFEYQIF